MGRKIEITDDAIKSPAQFAMTKAIEGGTSGAAAMTIQVKKKLIKQCFSLVFQLFYLL